MQNSLNLEGVEQQPLKEYTERAYLDYSMYVILYRALPQIGDGLFQINTDLGDQDSSPIEDMVDDQGT